MHCVATTPAVSLTFSHIASCSVASVCVCVPLCLCFCVVSVRLSISIRENLEGEYSGLEHEVVDGVVESLKVRDGERREEGGGWGGGEEEDGAEEGKAEGQKGWEANRQTRLVAICL